MSLLNYYMECKYTNNLSISKFLNLNYQLFPFNACQYTLKFFVNQYVVIVWFLKLYLLQLVSLQALISKNYSLKFAILKNNRTFAPWKNYVIKI